MSNYIVVDFEGYPNPKKFFFKEFCYVHVNTGQYFNFHLKTKPSYKYTKTDKWLVQYFHKIPKEYGHYSYKELKQHLNIVFNDPNITFLVKGIEKLRILQTELGGNYINIEELGCPKLSVIVFVFINHIIIINIAHSRKL